MGNEMWIYRASQWLPRAALGLRILNRPDAVEPVKNVNLGRNCRLPIKVIGNR